MYSLIMRVRSSNARSSAVFFRLFFAIVFHSEMMPLRVAVGKWLFQEGR